MRGLPPVTIRTAERRFRSGPNLLSDLTSLAVDGLAPKWFSSSTTQDSMGIEWMTVIYQRCSTTDSVRGSNVTKDGQGSLCLALSIQNLFGNFSAGRLPASC